MERIVETEHGFRLMRDDSDLCIVEVWRYLFNWRLVSMLPDQSLTTERGYCFFGTGLESLSRAIAAGLTWDDPLRSDPPDYDKRAF